MTRERRPIIIEDAIVPDAGKQDIFAEKSRAAWHQNTDAVPRCDFSAGRVSTVAIAGNMRAVTLWRRSLYGMALTDIKQDPEMPGTCASGLARLITAIAGDRLSPAQFVIVAPPKRRHPGKENFASRMCSRLAEIIGIPFVDDLVVCSSRQRVNPEFSFALPLPGQHNIIVADDIITTGATLAEMRRLISSAGKNSLFFAAILNRK